jgi:ferredoxin-thioredoxin reductase catalytic subunit
VHGRKSTQKNNGWVLNPDKKVLTTVILGMARIKNNSGDQYCPCRLRSGDKEKDRDLAEQGAEGFETVF